MPQFVKAIGAMQTAKFYQVDNRLSLLVSVQLAALLPIIIEIVKAAYVGRPYRA